MAEYLFPQRKEYYDSLAKKALDYFVFERNNSTDETTEELSKPTTDPKYKQRKSRTNFFTDIANWTSRLIQAQILQDEGVKQKA